MARTKKQKKHDSAEPAPPAPGARPDTEPAGTPAQPEPHAAEAGPIAEPGAVPLERFLRLQADFENFRKRTVRERAETYRRANEDIMESLLPVLDHLDLALQSAPESGGDPVAEGMRLVGEQLRSVLGKFGLARIDAAGKPFDPAEHEAVSHLASDEAPENHVMIQTRPGYRLGDYLLRPAQVVVSSGPAAGDGNGKDGD